MHAEIALVMALSHLADLPVVEVDRDNVQVTGSCRIRVIADPIIDADGDGVIHITADDVTVQFEGAPLRSAAPGTQPDAYSGIGVRITGRNVTLSGFDVGGFKVGVHALGADGLHVFEGTLSGNFRQHLGSTVQAEDSGDWLWPHDNDEHQWFENYGAGLYIERSRGVTIHDVTVRAGQNGIILDRVDEAKLYDNDCSFLSGWGLAMWRSSRNVVTRNAFDFCVRGYSHGVYNRGQDSAGILMFEQCRDNLFAENSITHGGDGFFAFSGREALGEANPRDDESWYVRRGNTGNRLINNDCSYAVAHGIELTFGFDNDIHANRLVGNGICGIWGGYSQDTVIAGNTFRDNGEMAYGLERGGINIEHGRNNTIRANTFRSNACGIHLWWDDDGDLLKTPWAKANERGSADTLIHDNTFEGDATAVHLRRTTGTRVSGNIFTKVGREYDLENSAIEDVTVAALPYEMPGYEVFGKTRPIGARAHLRGREHILIDEWGPYDWNSPRMLFVKQGTIPSGETFLEYRGLGTDAGFEAGAVTLPSSKVRTVYFQSAETSKPERVRFYFPEIANSVRRVEVAWRFPDGPWEREQRTIIEADWSVRQFASSVDPREDVEQWRRAAETAPVRSVPAMDFTFGMKGPEGLDRIDHFGTIATTSLEIPEGQWRIRTTSDDGIRVWLDEQLVIDDWTWHGPAKHDHVFTIDAKRHIALRVEHFELDGYAVLKLDLEPAD